MTKTTQTLLTLFNADSFCNVYCSEFLGKRLNNKVHNHTPFVSEDEGLNNTSTPSTQPKFHLKTQKAQATGKLYNVGLESICSVLDMKKMTLTKRHSSRMLTSRLPTLRGRAEQAPPPRIVRYKSSKFEHVQGSGSQTLYWGGGVEWEVGGYLYRGDQVEHVGGGTISPLPMMHWPSTYRDASLKRMTDTTENITFSQLSWLVVGLA